MKYEIDTNNIKVTNAVASLMNGAFETGLNPAWYYVTSLNEHGFLDAAFADGEEGDNYYTPSGARARTDWKIEGCLCDPDDPDDHQSLLIYVDAKFAVEQLNTMADSYNVPWLAEKADAFLRYLVALQEDKEDRAEHILFQEYNPDGVHDDALTQYIFASDVIFG